MKALDTKRLILRRFRPSDLEDFHTYGKNPNVGSMAGWEAHSDKEMSLHSLQSFVECDDVWTIEHKECKRVIGHIKVYPDENRGQLSEKNQAKLINYALSEEYWGQGYMTEAVKRVVVYVFSEMNAKILTAFHFPDNQRSKRVIEKCGFGYETTLRKAYKNYDGQLLDSVCYSISFSQLNGEA